MNKYIESNMFFFFAKYYCNFEILISSNVLQKMNIEKHETQKVTPPVYIMVHVSQAISMYYTNILLSS